MDRHALTDPVLACGALETLQVSHVSAPDVMSGNIKATAPGHLKRNTLLAPVHGYKGFSNLQLSAGVVFNSSFSSHISHRRALRSRAATAPRLGPCKCRAADTQQGANKSPGACMLQV